MKTYKEIADELIRNEEKFNMEIGLLELNRNLNELFGKRTPEDMENLGDYLEISVGEIYTWLGNANERMKNKELGKIFGRICHLSIYLDIYFKTITDKAE